MSENIKKRNNNEVTIKDIAKEAGVSICTVSHVINKTHYVSKELTDRVNEAIKKYNYRMDISASSLRKKVSKMIGVIIPNSSSQFFAFLTKHIEKFSREIGYHVVICNSDYDSKLDIEHIEALRARNIDGIIMIPASEDINCYKKIFEHKIPIVFIERKINGINCESVISDSYDTISQVVDYLVDLGHKKIAYIGREKELFHSKRRFKAYVDSIKRNNLPLVREFIIFRTTNFRYQEGCSDMMQLLDLEDKPTAVLVFDDVLAIGAIKAIKDRGYKVPEDFSVVGFDDIEIDKFIEPQLTSITTMKKEISRTAFNLLINKINKKNIRKKQVFIKTKLVIRGSTGKAKSC